MAPGEARPEERRPEEFCDMDIVEADDGAELLQEEGSCRGAVVVHGWGLHAMARSRGVRATALLGAAAAACLLAVASRGKAAGVLPRGASVRQSLALVESQQELDAKIAQMKATHPGWDPNYWDGLVKGRKAGGALSPNENLNDGNTCRSDEEISGGLCYKKCSLLTNNEYAIRTTAFTCCKSQPCHPFNSRKDMGLCSGFAVGGGDGTGRSCPHLPGSCLTDEDMHLGTCYKKCSILTNNEFNYRLTNYVCCKEKPGYKCMMPGNVKFSKSFDVGGGLGDGDASTPGTAHTPMPQLTEA